MGRNKFPDETVQKILDASLALFLEKGFEQTTILDIVENMGGLTRGAFYHHFKSKEEVLDALGDKLFFDNNPFEKANKQTNLNAIEKLRYIILHSMDDTDSRKVSIMTVQSLESPALLLRVLEDNRDLVAPAFEKIIEEGFNDGSIKKGNAKLLSQILTFLTNFWMIPSLYPITEAEVTEKLCLIKEITDNLGMPILTDELIALTINNAVEV